VDGKDRWHVAKPCSDCPFRRECGIRLYADRIREIVELHVAPANGQGGSFPCHKTVDHDERDRTTEKQCAGALIFMYKNEASTQLSRVMERLGAVDPDLATGDHPEIFEDLDQMLEHALDTRQTRRRKSSRRR
jgi:hypothetical protein